MTSYLTSIDIFSLSRTVFEIFNFKVFRVWPWPLTFRGHLRSKIFSPFESPCRTSYLTSIDTFSLSCTVFEIFDFKVFRVWPWPLTFRGHLGSNIFSPFESPYMTSYLTSIEVVVFFKIQVKLLIYFLRSLLLSLPPMLHVQVGAEDGRMLLRSVVLLRALYDFDENKSANSIWNQGMTEACEDYKCKYHHRV